MIDIIGGELYQWDVGRSVSVENTEADYVHFANQGDSKAVKMEFAEGTAKIPDYLLQTGKQLCVYVVVNGVTIESKMFPVKKRERPEDYVYNEDERNFIYALITETQEAANTAKQVARDLLEAKGNGEFKGEPGEAGPQGPQGDKGEKGDKGDDGIAPRMRISSETHMWEISTDDGDTWTPTYVRAQGDDGYTPQKGEDYWTDADKAEMVNAVLAALPDGDEVAY